MRETRADTAQAIGLAVLLHGLLLAMLFFGMLWNWRSAPISAAGSPISAELASTADLSAAMQRTLRNRPKPIEEPKPLPEPQQEPEEAAPLPQPEPEPTPQDSPNPQQKSPQDFIVNPDNRSQEAVVEQPTPTPSTEKELQEEKRRQDQVDLTEQQRQEEAQRQRRLSEMELERQKQLEDIRRRREQAAREANLAQEKLKQLADARAVEASENAAAPPPGNQGVDTGLAAAYAAALQAAIVDKWTRPDTVPLGTQCRLNIRQLPGGRVLSAEVSSPCAYDEQGRRSIEAAVLKAQPLPYAGFESVFQRTLILNFRAQDR